MPFKNALHKKVALSIISLLIGLLLATAGLRVLKPLQASMDTTTLGNAGDFIVTALMISGGGECPQKWRGAAINNSSAHGPLGPSLTQSEPLIIRLFRHFSGLRSQVQTSTVE